MRLPPITTVPTDRRLEPLNSLIGADLFVGGRAAGVTPSVK
jgi:hypothetical protein